MSSLDGYVCRTNLEGCGCGGYAAVPAWKVTEGRKVVLLKAWISGSDF